MKRSKKFFYLAAIPQAFFFLSCVVSVLVSCQRETHSETTARVPIRIPDPEPRTKADLRKAKQNIIDHLVTGSSYGSKTLAGTNPRSLLSKGLIKGIFAVKGLPRFQVKELLDEILAPSGGDCGGASCSRVFGVKPDETELFLDELYLSVTKSRGLKDAEYASQYGLLVGSLRKADQTAWNRPTVDGLSYLPNGEIDRTEGVGAFMDLPLEKGTRNLDVGGGAHESNTNYLSSRGVTNYVYDPYARSDDHNQKTLLKVKSSPVDTVTSMSILNVIDDSAARLAHIRLCKTSLRPGGKAYFKVWSGNGSGKGEQILGGYQSNRDAKSYIQDLKQVFGDKNVRFDENLQTLVVINQ